MAMITSAVNAVNYTGEDRPVTIELKDTKEAVGFSFFDTGQGTTFWFSSKKANCKAKNTI
jgi:hypothetical protein